MVPSDPANISDESLRAIERLLEQITHDRESLRKSGYANALAGMERLDALAREADELKVALAAGIKPSEPPVKRTSGVDANE